MGRNSDNLDLKNQSEMSLQLALAPIAATMVLIGIQVFILKGPPHIPLILGTAITAVLGLCRGMHWHDIGRAMSTSIATSVPVILIFMLVGMTIATWILSGTVPLLIYAGLQVINPQFFLPTCCIVCAIVSLFTGTSWGTVGTVGLALMAVGEGVGLSPALTAGAIVSGAWFGDKLSPLSDTTNYTAAIAGVDLYTHIRNLLPTTVPSMTLAIIAYGVIGFSSASIGTGDAVATIENTIQSVFRLGIYCLIPPFVIALTIYKRIPPIPGIFLGVLAAGVVAILGQGATLSELFSAAMNGYQSQTGINAVDQLLSKGGLMSMMWVISLVIIALGFGGVLDATGCLRSIVSHFAKHLSTRGRLITGTLFLNLGFNFAGNAFVAYTIPGKMLLPFFVQMGIAPQNLSRALEDGATMSAPLIPWNSGGLFVSSALGVPVLAYAPFAFANLLAPLFDLLWAWTGWFVPRSSPEGISDTSDEERVIND